MISIIIDNKTTMKVELNGISSSFRKLFWRVSQGSVLGPLFFSIYINDFGQILNIYGLVLFAKLIFLV